MPSPIALSENRRIRLRVLRRGWGICVFMGFLVVLLGVGGADAASRPGVTVVDTRPLGLTLELFVPDVRLDESRVQAGAVRVEAPALGDGRTGVPGQPSLPATSVLVAVPVDASVRLHVLSQEVGQRIAAMPWEAVPFEQPKWADGISSQTTDTGAAPDFTQDAIGTERIYRASDSRELATAAAAYQPVVLADEGYLRDQRYVRLLLQPFEVRADGSLWVHERIRVALDFDGVAKASSSSLTSQDPYFEPVFRRSFINYEQGRGWRQVASAGTPSASPIQVPPERLRIVTDADGIYTLGYDDLVAAGLKLQKIDARSFSLSSRGQEVALWLTGEADGRFDPGDTLSFYGQRSHSRYSDERVYWLAWGQVQGKRMATVDVSPALGGPLVTSYTATLHQEQNNIYLSSDPPNGEADRWYWDRYAVGGRTQIPTLTMDVPVTAVVPGQQAELTVAVRGYTSFYATDPDHRLDFSINNQVVGRGEGDGQELLLGTYPFSSDILTASANSFSLFAPGDTGASSDVGYLDWFEIHYVRELHAEDEHLYFADTLTGRHLYQVDGFSNGGLELFDISDPAQPLRLLNAAESGGAGVQVQFSAAGDGDNAFLIQHPDRRLSPVRIEADFVTSYRTPFHQADTIIITYPDFIDAIQPLATYRYDQGYNVMMVNVQDVYDEFNDGELSPWAIRDFLDYAYHHWQEPHPAFVLLVGDGTYDFLDYEGTGVVNYIPPLLDIVDPFLRETATDNRLVTVSGADILPDMFIGRFPARTSAQVATMVAKTIQYETAPWPGDWQLRNLFVADNADTAGNFAYLSNEVADHLLPGAYDSLKQKIYLGVNYSSSTVARQDIRQAFNQGAFLTNYVGHGQVTFWASEFIFRGEDAAALINGGRLPVHLSMTCLDGSFQEPTRESLAETLVLNPNGGAVAVWASTGLGVAHGHDYLHRGFYSALYEDGNILLGDLIVAGKLALYTGDTLGVFHDLIDTFNLMGDPALRLGLASTDLAIELVAAPTGELAPGDPVRLRFRISNLGDMPAPGVHVDVTLPALDNLSATSDLGPVQIITGDPVRFRLDDLDVGASTVLEINGEVPRQLSSSEYMITARADSAWADENPADNSISNIELRLAAADLATTLTGDPARALAVGEAFHLQIGYQNGGRGLATDGVITLPLPSGISGLSWTASDAAVTQTSSAPLVFNLPDLPQNTGGTIDIQAVAGYALLRTFLQAVAHTPWVDADLSNNISAALPFAVAAADAGETNDTMATATTLPLPGRLRDRSYDRPGDVDWYVFSAKAGVRYRFYTDALTDGGDTLLILYDAGGQEIMRSDDVGPGVKWSSLAWQPAAGGVSYLQVTRPGGGGPLFLYDLVADRGFDVYMPVLWTQWQMPTPPSAPTPTPTLFPTATFTPTPKPSRPTLTPTPSPTPTLTPTPVVGQCLPSPTTTIPLGGEPQALAAAENRVLAGIADTNTVAVIDSQTIEMIASHSSGGNTPSGIATWSSLYYVSNRGDNSVSIFDLATDTRLTTFPTGSQPAALDVTASGYLYVANPGANALSVHDSVGGTLVRTIPLSGTPSQVLAVGDTAWVTLASGPKGLLAIDSAGTVLNTIPSIPAGTSDMVADSRTGLIYVSHPAAHDIYVIDRFQRIVVAKFKLPFAPFGLEINTMNEQLYAVDAASNQLMVLDLLNGDVLGQRPLDQQGPTGGLGIVYLDGHVYVANAAAHSLSVFAAPPCFH